MNAQIDCQNVQTRSRVIITNNFLICLIIIIIIIILCLSMFSLLQQNFPFFPRAKTLFSQGIFFRSDFDAARTRLIISIENPSRTRDSRSEICQYVQIVTHARAHPRCVASIQAFSRQRVSPDIDIFYNSRHAVATIRFHRHRHMNHKIVKHLDESYIGGAINSAKKEL